MRRVAFYVLIALTLLGCILPINAASTPNGTPTHSLIAQATPSLIPAATYTFASASATPTRGAPHFASPTPPPNPGTTVTSSGSSKILLHPGFYWTLALPQDWLITYDRGFEVLANDPGQKEYVRLFSQLWSTEKERLATAGDYVNYWMHSPYGNIFPIYANGTQVSETEISPNKFGGPYRRYEFDDAKLSINYLQLYASGGGPNSAVVTAWAYKASFGSPQSALEGILDSFALLKPP